MACELQIESADNQIRRVQLEEDSYSLGRAHSNKLCYPEDASLSRNHMLVERDGDGWVVSDLGSKNGTLVNGTRITGKHRLQPGDRLTAGQLTLRYIDPEAGATEHRVAAPRSW